MSDTERGAFLESHIAEYAEEKFRAGLWTREEALDRSRAEIASTVGDSPGRGPHRFYTGLDSNGRKVGWIWLVPVPGEGSNPVGRWLHQITIEEGLRRRGYGRALLRAAEDEVHATGGRELRFNVFAWNNAAVAMYRVSGYEVAAEYASGLVMRKYLAQADAAGGGLYGISSYATPMAIEAVPQALWFFLPAFVANPSAVLWGGGPTIDFGHTLRDGERLFGDGKTWRGLFGGTLSGAILGLLLTLPFVLLSPGSTWSFGAPLEAFLASAILALGALLGDLVGAFIKRRMHKPRGAKAPVLDQYDFVVGGLVLSLLVAGWSIPRFFSGDAWYGLLAIILITPALHRGVNIVGYRMGKKHEPW